MRPPQGTAQMLPQEQPPVSETRSRVNRGEPPSADAWHTTPCPELSTPPGSQPAARLAPPAKASIEDTRASSRRDERTLRTRPTNANGLRPAAGGSNAARRPMRTRLADCVPSESRLLLREKRRPSCAASCRTLIGESALWGARMADSLR